MAGLGLHKDMRSVFNPTSADVNVTLLGEAILIPAKSSVVLPDNLGKALQELLPGMEYAELTETAVAAMPVPEVPKEKKAKAKVKKSKKK